MPVQLSEKESQFLAVVIQSMNDVPQVDFEKIKEQVGHKYARNARAAFLKIWGKLKEGDGEGASASGESESKPTTPAKKSVGKTTTPRKASEGGIKKTPRKSKAKKDESDGEEIKLEAADETKLEEVQETTEVSKKQAEEFDSESDADGKSRQSFPCQEQTDQLVIREDGFPEGTTSETIKSEAEAIGMEESEYRYAVKSAVFQELASE